ncbi:MAG: squalene synthase HpnD [Alphaproteobacteria bacterium]|nr:squalene synthase HpnD [Alphaproteobacteria bacterium]
MGKIPHSGDDRLHDLPSRAEAEAHVQRIMQQSRSSFSAGMACLPPDRRRAMHALYAFCRVVDDIADSESLSADEKLRQLALWDDRIIHLGHGQATEAITVALRPHVADFDLRMNDFHDIIAGMRMDAITTLCAPDAATLDLYCDRVASAVGRISVRIFGDRSADADQVAYHLGRALQLTNILRDLAEDAARGRLYLPRDLLLDYGIPPSPTDALTHPQLPLVCTKLAKRAGGHFLQAEQAAARCDKTAMRPARLMGTYYAAILEKLRKHGWKNIHDRVSLSPLEKIWLTCQCALAA